MLDALVQGVLLGGYYALLAAGLSLMFGVVRFINLAHGDLAILGAYLCITLVSKLGVNPWLAALLVIPVMAALGWVLQATLFQRTLKGGPLMPLLTTFGLGAVLQNGIYGGWGSNTVSLGNAIGPLSYASWSVPVLNISVGVLPVLTFASALVLLLALQALLHHSRLGRAIRATASDAEAAQLSGIDTLRVHRAAAAIAVALASVAGVFLAMRGLVEPYSGPVQLIFAFEAVVIGGIGSLRGTLIGGVVLGVAQSLGALLAPQWFQLAGHLVFLLVLGARMLQEFVHMRGGFQHIFQRS
jgi:branched-chain amino acid transport system permease protein